MDSLKDLEVFEKKEVKKFYALKYEGTFSTFQKWKKLIKELIGEGRFSAYRFWKLKEDLSLQENYKKYGDVVVLENLEDDFDPMLKDATSVFNFKPANGSASLYLSDDDCSDYIVFVVYKGKVTEILNLTEVEFKKQFRS